MDGRTRSAGRSTGADSRGGAGRDSIRISCPHHGRQFRGSTSRHFVYVSPDGSRYAEAINDSVTGQENSAYMVLSVYETASKKLLTKIQFDGFAASFKFSPDNRFLAAIRYPDLVTQGTLAESGLAILDLADAVCAIDSPRRL